MTTGSGSRRPPSAPDTSRLWVCLFRKVATSPRPTIDEPPAWRSSTKPRPGDCGPMKRRSASAECKGRETGLMAREGMTRQIVKPLYVLDLSQGLVGLTHEHPTREHPIASVHAPILCLDSRSRLNSLQLRAAMLNVTSWLYRPACGSRLRSWHPAGGLALRSGFAEPSRPSWRIRLVSWSRPDLCWPICLRVR